MADRLPLVSIILIVHNGMPHVREAVESVKALSYGNYELVIQDGGSTDGTVEYLRALTGFRHVSFESRPDHGIGHAYHLALARCSGEIVATIDADNRLCPNALDIAVREFAAHPEAAVVYGTCRVIDEAGAFVHTFLPDEFDLLGLLDGSIVPPFASSFFSRKMCGDRLYFDEDFPTVPDFALWLRLADVPIHRILETLVEVRIGPMSSTYRPQSYDQQSSYKILAATRYLSGAGGSSALAALSARATAGINLWAVDSMQVIGGPQERIDQFFEHAVRGNVRSERFREVVSRARPRLHGIDPALGHELLSCGREFLERGRANDALVYFELLERSKYTAPELPVLLEESRRQAIHLQEEVNRRDELLIEQTREVQALVKQTREMQVEIDRRDELLSAVQAERGDAVRIREKMLEDLQAERVEAVRIRDEIIERLHTVREQERGQRHRVLSWLRSKFVALRD